MGLMNSSARIKAVHTTVLLVCTLVDVRTYVRPAPIQVLELKCPVDVDSFMLTKSPYLPVSMRSSSVIEEWSVTSLSLFKPERTGCGRRTNTDRCDVTCCLIVSRLIDNCCLFNSELAPVDCFRTGLQCLHTVKVMLKEVTCTGCVDIFIERKCDCACCHRQSQQKRSKNCSEKHLVFELLWQCDI